MKPLDQIARGLKIAVLQTGRAPDELQAEHGDYDAMCKALLGLAPVEAQTFAVLDHEFPEEPAAFDVLLITGSRHGVYEDHAWIAPLEDLIRAAYGRGQKMIGICFGHQIIAQALGGRVEKSAKGFGVGLMDYDLERSDGSQTPVSLCAWHQDQIIEAPQGARVIARSPFCEIAGLQYSDKAITFQAHPEFSRAYVRDLIALRTPAMLDQDLSRSALESLEGAAHPDAIRLELAAFLSAD
ncbi:MAG: type 1 glutamine amidotransferase [Pseudomonadota bacterium]